MFGFFKKKNKTVKPLSRFALTRQAAFLDLVKEVSEIKKPIYVFYFFEESKNYLKGLLTTEYLSFKDIANEPSSYDCDIYFINARTFAPHLFKFTTSKMVYCLDHFPLHSVFSGLGLGLAEMATPPELIIYGGLDEPIFNRFGGERLQQLMQKLGISDSEMIEHAMISAAIESAQKKIEAKVIVESKAASASDWFTLNYNQ